MTPIETSLNIIPSRAHPALRVMEGIAGEGRSIRRVREKEVRSVEATPYTILPPLSPARVRYAEHTSAFLLSHPPPHSRAAPVVPGVPSLRSTNNNALLPSGCDPLTRHTTPFALATRRDATPTHRAVCSRFSRRSQQITGFRGMVSCDKPVYDFRKAIRLEGAKLSSDNTYDSFFFCPSLSFSLN